MAQVIWGLSTQSSQLSFLLKLRGFVPPQSWSTSAQLCQALLRAEQWVGFARMGPRSRIDHHGEQPELASMSGLHSASSNFHRSFYIRWRVFSVSSIFFTTHSLAQYTAYSLSIPTRKMHASAFTVLAVGLLASLNLASPFTLNSRQAPWDAGQICEGLIAKAPYCCDAGTSSGCIRGSMYNPQLSKLL